VLELNSHRKYAAKSNKGSNQGRRGGAGNLGPAGFFEGVGRQLFPSAIRG